MDFVLRPGESLEFRWDKKGKYYSGKGGLSSWTGAAECVANGLMCHRPDLSGPVAAKGTTSAENAVFDAAAGTIRAEHAGKPAAVAWRFASPYVFVGGKVTANLKLPTGAG